MTAEEQTRLKETLELTGLNKAQVDRILRDVGYIVSQVAFRAKK